MQSEHIPYFLWSDNTTALQWIHKPLHELKLYVANRVKKIKELTEVRTWQHIRTAENPADLVIRGLLAGEIVNNPLWWNEPSWLAKEQKCWPEPLDIRTIDVSNDARAELKVHKVQNVQLASKGFEIFVPRFKLVPNSLVPLIEYSRNIGELTRVLSYVFRFINNCRSEGEVKKDGRIEISYSEKGFMDKDNLIRADTRVKNASLPYDAKFPVIIPHKSNLSRLLISQAHRETEHGEVQVMLQYIRSRYWSHDLRREIKSCISCCSICKRCKGESGKQLMAELPTDRVNRNRAFLFTGVDYAGPFELCEHHSSRAKRRKCWIAIFVCMVTRAVHIDLVTDASSAAFISCYERFIGRRGHCNKLFSDNGTAFTGAEKGFRIAFQAWSAPDSIEHLNKKGTRWVFMKPAAPHQGGIYEAAVKSAKHHITRVIGAKHFSYEHFLTFLTKVEAILNSRPLYAPSDDPSNALVITPAHFIIGEPFPLPPPIDVPMGSNYSMQRIRAEQKVMLESFWRSWHNDYLSTLMPRNKWLEEKDNLKVGQVVLLQDENLPPSKWLMAKVCELLPGRDGLVRNVVVEIATRKKPRPGETRGKRKRLTRAIQKLCILPSEPCEPFLCLKDAVSHSACDESSVQIEEVSGDAT